MSSNSARGLMPPTKYSEKKEGALFPRPQIASGASIAAVASGAMPSTSLQTQRAAKAFLPPSQKPAQSNPTPIGNR